MPDSLSSIRDADSGEEAIKILSDEYCQNPFDKEPLIQGIFCYIIWSIYLSQIIAIVEHYPILVELTKQYSMVLDSEESSDQNSVCFTFQTRVFKFILDFSRSKNPFV